MLPGLTKFAVSTRYGAALFPLVAWTRDLLWKIRRERSYLLYVRHAVLPSDRRAINWLQEVIFK